MNKIEPSWLSKFFQKKHYIASWFGLSIGILSVFRFILHKPDVVKIFCYNLTTPGYLLVLWNPIVLWFATSGLLVGLGAQLLLAMQNLSVFLEGEILNEDAAVKDIVLHFLKLKQCCRSYSDIFGPISFISLFYTTGAASYAIYTEIWPNSGITGVEYLLWNISALYANVSIGNELKLEAGKFSTKFRKLQLEQQVQHDRGLYGDGLYLVKSMANWKWRFGNCDLFVVDNGLYVG
ncbi:unnamed protein product, partial [Allacma fusca]